MTAKERRAFVQTENNAQHEVCTFYLGLSFTCCRISAALALTPGSFDFCGRAIVLEILKKRRARVYRAVPMPQDTLHTIDLCRHPESFGLGSSGTLGNGAGISGDQTKWWRFFISRYTRVETARMALLRRVIQRP
jgi:hypothetical protein